jgi:hypothetical protein
MKIKFNDAIHNWSDDCFEIERGKRGTYVRITQETVNNTIEVFLSLADIEQIYNEMKKGLVLD